MRRILLIIFALSGCAWGQFPNSAWSLLPPLVQSRVTSSNVSTLAYPKSVVSGHLLVCKSVWQTAVATPTVSDTLGSTWVQAILVTANTQKIGVYIASANGSGADTCTFTETGATSQTMEIEEYTAAYGTTVDVTSNTTFSGTPGTITATNVTTTSTGDLLLPVMASAVGNMTALAGTGYFQTGMTRASLGIGNEYKIAGAPGSYGATFGNFSNTSGTIVLIAIKPASEQIVDTSLPNAILNQAYSYQLTGIGGAGTGLTWSITSGSLQPGLSLNSSTGLISGTPTNGGANSIDFQISDGTNTASATLSLGVYSSANTITESACDASYTATSGDVNVVVTRIANGSVGAITDTLGTVYTPVANVGFTTSLRTHITLWVGVPSSSGTDALTFVDITGTKCGAFRNAVAYVDVGDFTQGSGASSSTATSNSLTTISDNSVLVAGMETGTSGASTTIQAPFTSFGGTTGFGQGYDVVTTQTGYTVDYALTSNTDTNWTIDMIALRPTGATLAPVTGSRHRKGVF